VLDPSFLNSINTDLLPVSDAVYNIGASDKRWRTIYAYETRTWTLRFTEAYGGMLHEAHISIDRPPPAIGVGVFKTFVAGESITFWEAVSLHSHGKVYRASPTYPNVIGIAVTSASAGHTLRVLVLGATLGIADEAIHPGSLLTYSPRTPGRLVKYYGHSHVIADYTAAPSYSETLGIALEGVTEAGKMFLVLVLPSK